MTETFNVQNRALMPLVDTLDLGRGSIDQVDEFAFCNEQVGCGGPDQSRNFAIFDFRAFK